ncbi:MAG: SH3 domain-containing protein [Synergistaceae bacterium]|jgi:hypothetical protein|nr:SH3 domain-containing protein [Synergistaceae bacterium]
METKNTRQRLDDLQDLLQTGYLTENEFRVARINALKESGVDIVIHGPRKSEAKHLHEEEEEGEPKGCGCALTALLLVALGIGVVFFVSSWPDRFGGSHVRAAREWMLDQWSSFFLDDAPSGPLPDPVIQRNAPLPAVIVVVSDDEAANPALSPDSLPFSPGDSPPPSSDIVSEAQVSEAQVSEARASGTQTATTVTPAFEPASSYSLLEPPAGPLAARVSLPTLDARIFSLPDIEFSEVNVSESVTAEEPDVIIVEPSVTPQAPAPSFQRRAEREDSLRRGIVSGRSVRIRSEPDTSTNDNVVGWGIRGDRFLVLEEGFAKDGSRWYRVRYEEGDKQGWISGTLVTLE